jgi:hypothetical protein
MIRNRNWIIPALMRVSLLAIDPYLLLAMHWNFAQKWISFLYLYDGNGVKINAPSDLILISLLNSCNNCAVSSWSDHFHVTVGCGVPSALHLIIPPVLLENVTTFGGSSMKKRDDSANVCLIAVKSKS